MERSAANIILCAGPLNSSSLPVGTNQSNGMIPVNGKPVIGWILDGLLQKQIRDATVVLRDQDHRLEAFLHRAYAERMSLHLSHVSGEGSIIHSLQCGLEGTPNNGLVRVILGDTLINDSFDADEDFVYTSEVHDARRWCLVVTNSSSHSVDYLDKQDLDGGPHQALAGYYHFTDGARLSSCVEASLTAGERELSAVLRRYAVSRPISVRPVKDWYDFGHIDNLIDARRRLISPRHFNSLTVNPVLNTITKISKHNEKLQDELDWYLTIPDELRVLTPRILSSRRVNGSLEIVQEYYGYPTLAELYVYGDLHLDTWLSTLRHVLRIHQELRRYMAELEPAQVEAMYFDKTRQRLCEWRLQSPEWAELLDRDTIVFNDRALLNVARLGVTLAERIQKLTAAVPASIIHGDFCFSNILFDINNQIIRLIDPRGSFGRKGIYGDARYDVAKLRHSVCGFYDFIVADAFDLRETPAGFCGQVQVHEIQQLVASAFDRMVSAAGYELDEIRLIEGLLFLAMLPLHDGHAQRQRMMYLTGLSLLNEVCKSANCD